VRYGRVRVRVRLSVIGVAESSLVQNSGVDACFALYSIVLLRSGWVEVIVSTTHTACTCCIT
jgi:hypothetical protein